jgi:branched-chain amino acid transport system ATP-binding protein
LLKANQIDVSYGDVQVVRGVSIEVLERQIVTLVGGNGAGKSTVLKTISGYLRPKSGSVEFCQTRIDQLPMHQIVDMGLVLIPEGREIFPKMTVLENLELGAYLPRFRTRATEALKRVFGMFPVLEERKKQLAGTLSGGEQQMLAIGRGLMSQPKLLMLDEPSLGLAPLLVEEIFKVLKNIRKLETTVLLVEQNVHHSLALCDYAFLLENGSIVLKGTGQELVQNKYMKEAYLGISA